MIRDAFDMSSKNGSDDSIKDVTGSHQARRPYLDLQSPLRGSRLGESRETQKRRRRRRRRRRSVALFHSFPANQVLSIRGERQRGVEERATAEVSAMVIRLPLYVSMPMVIILVLILCFFTGGVTFSRTGSARERVVQVDINIFVIICCR